MTYHDNATASLQDAPEADKTYFTLEHANRALPYVRRIVDDIMAVYRDVVALRRRMETDESDGSGVERQYQEAIDRLGELVDEVQAVGVELKDFERGLVDFPALADDREVMLCWRAGEEHVSHWHEVDAGYAGRQPTDSLGRA